MSRSFPSSPPITLTRCRRWFGWVTALGLVVLAVGCGGTSGPPTAVTTGEAVVARVIDGDTMKLSDGRTVRYIGVDTPEVRRRRGGEWVREPEPYAVEATEANRRLVEGRAVRLEQDVQSHDRYGRLLVYVYVDDLFVNAELVRQGYAVPLTIPPNVKYAELFRELAREARQAQRGLWRSR